MTTIVIRDGVIAADTRIWSADRHYGTTSKLARSRDGWWAAGCGEAALWHDFLGWFRRRSINGTLSRNALWRNSMIRWKDSCVLMLSPKGEMWFYEGHAPVKFDAPFVAEGSGAAYALGAMETGASAVTAIKVASRFDPATGGIVEFCRPGDRHIASSAIELGANPQIVSLPYSSTWKAPSNEDNQQVQLTPAIGRSRQKGSILKG